MSSGCIVDGVGGDGKGGGAEGGEGMGGGSTLAARVTEEGEEGRRMEGEMVMVERLEKTDHPEEGEGVDREVLLPQRFWELQETRAPRKELGTGWKWLDLQSSHRDKPPQPETTSNWKIHTLVAIKTGFEPKLEKRISRALIAPDKSCCIKVVTVFTTASLLAYPCGIFSISPWYDRLSPRLSACVEIVEVMDVCKFASLSCIAAKLCSEPSIVLPSYCRTLLKC